MRYFPAFIDLDRANTLVVGGGESAAQKVRLLRKTTSRIKVVAPAVTDELAGLAASGTVEWTAERFGPRHLDHCRLVFATTGNRITDAGVAFAARARSIPVNVVDVPQLCTFITPAIVDRDPVVVAIGTEGAAPVLAQKIKGMLEAWLPARLGELTAFAAGWRHQVIQRIESGSARRRFWRGFFDGEIAQRYLANDVDGANSLIAQTLDTQDGIAPKRGRVSLVGAGPGDPDLLTFKAARCLQQADVIVTDRLVNPAILEVARRDARRVFVGKKPGQHSISQSEINAILVREAEAGHDVVRLKGGDPLIFGRAAEEVEAVRQAGFDIYIVPGVTSALAAAARTGALLTERDTQRSLTIMTGHASDGPAEHDWPALAKVGRSLAIYMGVGAASRIQSRLLDAGIDPTTPLTIVEHATLPQERVVEGRIDSLGKLIASAGIKGPAVIFVGARTTLTEYQLHALKEAA